MNVLTISARKNKGGASYIAGLIHSYLEGIGIVSKYFVGYGRLGFSYEAENKHVINAKFWLKFSPVINWVFHMIFSRDIISPREKQLVELVKESDVIICHILHSYFIDYKYLIDIVNSYNQNCKVILVNHDSWLYTGRCAIIETCNEWKNKCENCNHLSNYPRGLIRNNRHLFNRKVKAVNSLRNVMFVSPTNWIKNDLKQVYPGIKTELIRNGINTEIFSTFGVKKIKGNDIKFCVSAYDLSQHGKINYDLTKQILELGYEIHFIGHNCPFVKYNNAIIHGYVSNKDVFVDILSQVDCYLFTSNIDNYPTVLIEAVCASNYIFYTPSKGADEIMNGENKWLGSVIQTIQEFKNTINSETFKNTIINYPKRLELKNKALDYYNMQNMLSKYHELIRE